MPTVHGDGPPNYRVVANCQTVVTRAVRKRRACRSSRRLVYKTNGIESIEQDG